MKLLIIINILDCNPNGDFFTLPIDGEQVVYDGVEATFSFDREGLAITTYPDSKIVKFALGETAIIFRGKEFLSSIINNFIPKYKIYTISINFSYRRYKSREKQCQGRNCDWHYS